MIIRTSTHGFGASREDDIEDEFCWMPGVPAFEVVQRCLGSIEKADLFYAWLDDLSAFGTVAEIGYASGRTHHHPFPIYA